MCSGLTYAYSDALSVDVRTSQGITQYDGVLCMSLVGADTCVCIGHNDVHVGTRYYMGDNLVLWCTPLWYLWFTTTCRLVRGTVWVGLYHMRVVVSACLTAVYG